MTIKASQLKAAIRICNGGLAKLKDFNERLRDHFGREDMDVFRDPGDGWLLLYNEDKNVPLSSIDMNHLLTLTYEQAVEYLKDKHI